MPSKVTLPFDRFRQISGNGNSQKLSTFLVQQRIGKLEFISDRFKWVVDLEKNKFIKIADNSIESVTRITLGQGISDIIQFITGDYKIKTVDVFRRKSLPSKSSFSNEVAFGKAAKLIESFIKKQLAEGNDEDWISYVNQSFNKLYDGINDLEIAIKILKASGIREEYSELWKYYRSLLDQTDKLGEYMDHIEKSIK